MTSGLAGRHECEEVDVHLGEILPFSARGLGESPPERLRVCVGLKKEILLWLRTVPGFYDIYCSQVKVVEVHNPDFLKFLREEVYNEEFLRQRKMLQSPVSTNTIEEQITQAQQV